MPRKQTAEPGILREPDNQRDPATGLLVGAVVGAVVGAEVGSGAVNGAPKERRASLASVWPGEILRIP